MPSSAVAAGKDAAGAAAASAVSVAASGFIQDFTQLVKSAVALLSSAGFALALSGGCMTGSTSAIAGFSCTAGASSATGSSRLVGASAIIGFGCSAGFGCSGIRLKNGPDSARATIG